MSTTQNLSSASTFHIPNGHALASLAMLILHLVIITCALGYSRAETMRNNVGLDLALGGVGLSDAPAKTANATPFDSGSRLRSPNEESRLVSAL